MPYDPKPPGRETLAYAFIIDGSGKVSQTKTAEFVHAPLADAVVEAAKALADAYTGEKGWDELDAALDAYERDARHG